MTTRLLTAIGCCVGFLMFEGAHLQAIEVTSQQVLIETKFANVSSTVTADMLNKIPSSRIDVSSLPAPAFKPLAVLSPSQTQDALNLLEEVNQIQVISGPNVSTAFNQRTRIMAGQGGAVINVVPKLTPGGHLGLSLTPGMQPIVIPPGDTLLVGETLGGPVRRDNIYFLTPRYNFTPTTGRGSYTGAPGPFQMGENVAPLNWNGPYIGIQWGYTRSGSDYRAKLTGEFNHFPDVQDDVASESEHEFDEDGFGLGGCAGYNYEFNNHWIFGVGVAGRKLWGLDGKRETGDFSVGKNGFFDVRQRFQTTYLVTAGPKFGRDLGNYFPYVTGGVAFGEVDPHQTILSTDFGPPKVGRVNEIQTGWYVGAGIQYRLPGNWSNWSLRGEYNYVDLGTIKYPSTSEGSNSWAVWNMTTLNEHSFNAGIVYNFGSLVSTSGH